MKCEQARLSKFRGTSCFLASLPIACEGEPGFFLELTEIDALSFLAVADEIGIFIVTGSITNLVGPVNPGFPDDDFQLILEVVAPADPMHRDLTPAPESL